MAVTAPVLQAAQALRQLNGRIPENKEKTLIRESAWVQQAILVQGLYIITRGTYSTRLYFTNVNYRSGHHTPFNTFWSYSNFSQIKSSKLWFYLFQVKSSRLLNANSPSQYTTSSVYICWYNCVCVCPSTRALIKYIYSIYLRFSVSCNGVHTREACVYKCCQTKPRLPASDTAAAGKTFPLSESCL